MIETVPRTVADASALSLLARLGVALCCFEGYCRALRLQTNSVQDFLSYMWEWPLRMTPEWFEEWETKRTTLVEFGLGAKLPDDLDGVLRQKGIELAEFRSLVEGTVEIIWGSFYAATDDRGSLRELSQVIAICEQRGVRPPSLEVFRESRFQDGHGWGERISKNLRDHWRTSGGV